MTAITFENIKRKIEKVPYDLWEDDRNSQEQVRYEHKTDFGNISLSISSKGARIGFYNSSLESLFSFESYETDTGNFKLEDYVADIVVKIKYSRSYENQKEKDKTKFKEWLQEKMSIYEIDKRRKISVRHIGNWEYSFSIVKDRNFSPKISAFPNKPTTKRGNINVVDYNQIEEMDYQEMESISKLFKYLDFSDEDNPSFLPKKVEKRSESDGVFYLQFSEATDDEIAEITKRYLIYRAENDRTRKYSNAELEGRIQ